MASDRGLVPELHNDTAVNVAGLLKGLTGQTREFSLWIDRFPLDDDLVAERVSGDLRLTRLRDGVMAQLTGTGTVELECARCLRAYPQPFSVEFSEEFQQIVDVRTGVDVELETELDDDTPRIDDNHILDIGEVLRQEIVIALPMRPDCGDQCPGPDLDRLNGDTAGETLVDDRLAALASLLDEPEPGR